MNILVIGTGAIGSFYGARLAKAGAKVSVVARSDYAAIKANGITVKSAQLGDDHFMPAHVLRAASELTTKPDYVLLGVKLTGDLDIPALLDGALGPDTAVVLIANGVEVEAPFAAACADHELISALAFVCVARTAPGQIWHQDYGRLEIGRYPNGPSPKADQLAATFIAGGIPCDVSADIVANRWKKCVWNAPFNALSVLTNGHTVKDILQHQEPLVRAIMQEVCAIAAASGYVLPVEWPDTLIDYSRKMVPYKTSMLLDYEAGRPMEIEAILGAAVRAGDAHGVPIPHLESIYALMKLRERNSSQAHVAKPIDVI